MKYRHAVVFTHISFYLDVRLDLASPHYPLITRAVIMKVPSPLSLMTSLVMKPPGVQILILMMTLTRFGVLTQR